MSDLGLLPNPYTQALETFPQGLYSLVQNGQYPSIAGGQSSGFSGAYQTNPAQLQALSGFGQKMMQQPQGQPMMAPAPAMPMTPFNRIVPRGLLPTTLQPFGLNQGGQ